MKSDREPTFPLNLSIDQAVRLDDLLAEVSQEDLMNPWNDESRAMFAKIREMLNYTPPRFPIGTRVRRRAPWADDKQVYVVVENRWVAPSVWTDYIREEDSKETWGGVGEIYLEEVS